MSRIRSTLDTVTKAVSGRVNTDLFAKITRLKPGATQGKTIEVKVECPEANAGAVMTVAAPEPPREKEVNKYIELHKEVLKSVSNLSSSAGNTTSADAKQTLQRFQPAAFTTNMDETYNHLAEHVNTYFGSDTQNDTASSTSQIQPSTLPKSSKDHILMAVPVSQKSTPETPPAIDKEGSVSSPLAPSAPAQDEGVSTVPISPRKGISHYLSYPKPHIQAFVGNYISPLVPKFRADSKSGTAEKDKTSGSEIAASQNAKSAESKETKEANEKAQRLLSQREKVDSYHCNLVEIFFEWKPCFKQLWSFIVFCGIDFGDNLMKIAKMKK